MMIISIEDKKKEAVSRMRTMGCTDEQVRGFENGFIVVTQGGMPVFADIKEKQMIHDIEERYNILVYAATHFEEWFGECYYFLYVSDYESDWIMERPQDDVVKVYGKNITYPDNSEFGSTYFGVFCGVLHTFPSEELYYQYKKAKQIQINLSKENFLVELEKRKDLFRPLGYSEEEVAELAYASFYGDKINTSASLRSTMEDVF